jgi:hypothetical protein
VLDDGRTACWCPVRDAGALAAALGSLLLDAARRASWRAARRGVRSYDWSTVARQVVEVYETVAGERRAGRGRPLARGGAAAGRGDEDDAGRLVTLLRRWIAELPGRSGA